MILSVAAGGEESQKPQNRLDGIILSRLADLSQEGDVVLKDR